MMVGDGNSTTGEVAMMDPWMTQRLAEEHRRDLRAVRQRSAVSSRSKVSVESAAVDPADVSMTHQSPVRIEATGRQPVRGYLGAWLIRAGTRLGGTSAHAQHFIDI
jgi:hypothetical protein